ncbi:MAG TPA: hypothetical protein VN705_25450 [Steroidobacteraceae bacterium]|jgi:hypothetical protein|nr:hypothetical protein [Steroidobacteraceae bacterium]
MRIEHDADRILSALAGLRSLAVEFSQSSTARELGSALWVAFVLCFRSLNELRRAVEERLAWATADEQFRATHMETTAGLPGVTADWVPSKDFDLIFATARGLLREEICTTPSAQTVTLR